MRTETSTENMGGRWSGMAMRTRRRRGQSTLEYVLVVGAILAAILGIAWTAMHPAVEKTVQQSADVVSAAADKVKTGLGL